ncbi:DUF2180 family protein [Kitasatospora sp. NPDC004799]|uniref:DUF2180 family protein n=1 Tax=Kitasatospora sp. NPDC004799 TaxID=3154460 RepID=UPI0033BB836C
MHCLECRSANTTSTAVGVCRGCGAGVCADHARTEAATLRSGPVLGPADKTVVRQILCPSCAAPVESGAGIPS